MGEVVVYAHGCFDLFHVGHLRYLQSAKALGDFLVVGVNTDEWVNTYGKKPIVPFEQRIEIVGALRCVDLAIPREGLLDPDTVRAHGITVNAVGAGQRQTEAHLQARKKLEEMGVTRVVMNRTEGISSTVLKKRIRKT